MNRSTRRTFLGKSALVTLGTTIAASGLVLGETAAETSLKSVDESVAEVLLSYGRTREMKEDGYQRVPVNSKSRRLPVSRLRIEVRDQDSFRRSFESLTELSERVVVEGNTVSFARDGRFFVIENTVA